MAQFDITPESQLPASYVQYSQGIRSDRDTALGDLFAGLADTLSRGVQEADRQVQENIQEDIFDEVEAIQDEFGVGSATDIQADYDASIPTPTGITRAMEHIQGLESAHQRGALKESHYWARLNSMVRQLRSKYPGYRAQIDQMVSSVTGNRPANALRSALMREWAEEGGQSELDKLEDWAVKQGRLPLDYYERQNNNEGYSLTELRNHIAKKTREDAERTARRATMAEEQDLGKLSGERAKRNFRIEANQYVQTALGDVNSAIGRNYAQVQQRINEAQRAMASGQPMDRRTLEELRGAFAELRQGIRDGLHSTFLESWDGDPNHSYAAVLTQEDVNAIVEGAMTPIATIEEALSSENPWGVLGATSAWLEAQDEEEARDFLKNVPHAQTLRTLSEQFGSEVASLYLQMTPEVQTAFARSVADYHRAKMATGQGSVTEAFRDGEATQQPAEYYNSIIDGWTNMIDQLDSMPAEWVRNNVQAMFGETSGAVLSRLDDGSRYQYYQKVVSPAVTQKMLELKRAGDMDSWDLYQRWTSQAFQILFNQSVTSLQELHTSANFSVDWDPVNFRFNAKVARNYLAGTPLSGFEEVPGRRQIENLNLAIQNIVPIIQENGGDVANEVFLMLTNMGYDPTAENVPGLPQMLLEAIWNRLPTMSVGAEAERRLGPDQRTRMQQRN